MFVCLEWIAFTPGSLNKSPVVLKIIVLALVTLKSTRLMGIPEPRMELLYLIRPYFARRFPCIGLTNRPKNTG